MGKLALLGAILLGSSGVSGVTAHQARHALVIDAKALPTSQIACHAVRLDQVCRVFDENTYTDPVIGPAVATGTTVFRISRKGNDYRVRIVSPDRFDIYSR